MTYTRCDLCGSIAKEAVQKVENGSFYKATPIRLPLPISDPGVHGANRELEDYDVCGKCLTELEEWVTSKRSKWNRGEDDCICGCDLCNGEAHCGSQDCGVAIVKANQKTRTK